MPESSSSETGTDGRDNDIPTPEETTALVSLEQEQSAGNQATGNPVGGEITLGRKPFWGKTREALSNASTRVSSTGAGLASKAASLGTLGVVKSAELGKQTYAVAGSAVEASKQAYAGSTLESAVNYVDAQLEERGAKQAISSTAGAVVGKLDEVTGKRLVELLEKRLQKQDAYNDILATRLAEALQRISVLENRFHELTSRPEVDPMSATEVRDEYR